MNITDTGFAPILLKTKGSGEEVLFNYRQMSIGQLEEILDEQIGFHNLRSVSLIVNEELTFINFLRIVNIFDEAEGYCLNFLAD